MTNGSPLDSFTILITDDDYINIIILQEALKDLNLPIEVAVNGKEALDILFKLKFKDVMLLLDLNMPVIDGYEVIKIMHDDPESYLNVKTIVISGSMRSDFDKSGLSPYIKFYIEKPFSIDDLVMKIKNAATDG